jgi:hypothetical protein
MYGPMSRLINKPLAKSFGPFDAIETFKVFKGFTQIKSETWFKYAAMQEGQQTRLLASYLPLKHQKGNLEIRRKWFSGRAAKVWNVCPVNT